MSDKTSTEKRELRGILFDLDGTLVDSLRVTFAGFNAAWGAFGIPPKSPAEIMAHFGPGERQIFEAVLGDETKAIDAEARYFDYTQQRLHEAPLFDGIGAMLEDCLAGNIPCGIVTGRGRESTRIILEHHGIYGRLPIIVCHEDVSNSKPSPEGIEKALRHLELTPAETAYVGDMVMDLRAAKRAGCVAIAAGWDSVHDPVAVEKETPDFYFRETREFRAFLASHYAM